MTKYVSHANATLDSNILFKSARCVLFTSLSQQLMETLF